MTQNRRQSRAEPDSKSPLNRPLMTQKSQEDPPAHRASERERLHPALRLNQQYPDVKPQRYWIGPKDDATAPSRPPTAMTDLNPEGGYARRADPAAPWRRLSLLLGFIIIFGLVVLFLLVTKTIGG